MGASDAARARACHATAPGDSGGLAVMSLNRDNRASRRVGSGNMFSRGERGRRQSRYIWHAEYTLLMGQAAVA